MMIVRLFQVDLWRLERIVGSIHRRGNPVTSSSSSSSSDSMVVCILLPLVPPRPAPSFPRVSSACCCCCFSPLAGAGGCLARASPRFSTKGRFKRSTSGCEIVGSIAHDLPITYLPRAWSYTHLAQTYLTSSCPLDQLDSAFTRYLSLSLSLHRIEAIC
jgi:hypothetical protein